MPSTEHMAGIVFFSGSPAVMCGLVVATDAPVSMGMRSWYDPIHSLVFRLSSNLFLNMMSV